MKQNSKAMHQKMHKPKKYHESQNISTVPLPGVKLKLAMSNFTGQNFSVDFFRALSQFPTTYNDSCQILGHSWFFQTSGHLEEIINCQRENFQCQHTEHNPRLGCFFLLTNLCI